MRCSHCEKIIKPLKFGGKYIKIIGTKYRTPPVFCSNVCCEYWLDIHDIEDDET